MQAKPSVVIAPKSLPLKIAYVRAQIRRCTSAYHKGSLPSHVYYDQLEELDRVMLKLHAHKSNSLEIWCIDNPSDLECREYDL